MLSDAALAANFTNEGGVDGTIRFLRNVMGLWVLSESPADVVRTSDLPEPARSGGRGARRWPRVVDIDAPEFLPPGDMPAPDRGRLRGDRPAAAVSRGAVVRCILDSLALAYRAHAPGGGCALGPRVDVVHVVGGGARNELLCRLTADACGLPSWPGPVEAAALGNVLVQARALGEDLPDLASMRALVRETQELRRYEPAGTRRLGRGGGPAAVLILRNA